MFKLTPLTAAILVIVSAQALADDSLSTQTQYGTANIADVKQTAAPLSTATQQQTGQGNDAAAVQDTATGTISQTQIGDYNAGYAEQLFEDNSTITQNQAGSSNISHASQSIGVGGGEALQRQEGTGNFSFIYQDSQEGTTAKTYQYGDGNVGDFDRRQTFRRGALCRGEEQ